MHLSISYNNDCQQRPPFITSQHPTTTTRLTACPSTSRSMSGAWHGPAACFTQGQSVQCFRQARLPMLLHLTHKRSGHTVSLVAEPQQHRGVLLALPRRPYHRLHVATQRQPPTVLSSRTRLRGVRGGREDAVSFSAGPNTAYGSSALS